MPFFISGEEFWDLFNSKEPLATSKKKQKTKHIDEHSLKRDARYVIMFGRHRPGKKTKVWEDDGYLTLVGQMAYLSTCNGRMLEEPTLLDEFDMKLVKERGELLIGNTEVQIVDEDK